MATSEKDRESLASRFTDWKDSAKEFLFKKPEIFQEAEQYLRKNFYDPGWIGTQVPGNQTWMETKPREAWESYEGITHPNLQRGLDMAKVLPNAAWNLAQWAGNMAWEGSNALDRYQMGDPLLKKETKYDLDAWASNKFGWDPYYEDNPYAEKNKDILEGIYDTAQAESDDYYSDILKQNDEDKDEWHDGATKYAEEQLPWAKWQRANPGVSTNEYYKELTDIYNKRMGTMYDDKLDTVFDNSLNSQMFSEYGFGEKDVSAFKDFDWWDYSRALEYATPEAEEFYKGVEIIPEVMFPLGSLSKIGKIPKLFSKSRKSEGIMKNAERLEDKRFDWAKRWMRDQGG
tara:strand:- start:270 stop:1301 length:1032 start_codon:yes stop_codon:yes gene_type:complete